MTRQPIYLLSTGALPDQLVTEASKGGMSLDVVPFIGIEYPDRSGEIENLLAQPRTVVFTSVHAVNAVARLVDGKPQWRIYCISGPTSEAVAEVFGAETAAGKAPSAAELAEVIRDREAGDRAQVIFFCGDRRREEMSSLGVTEKVVYRTVLTPSRIRRHYEGIAFFSPSAVESFFSVNVIAAEIPLFAIGPTTSAAIRVACPNPVITLGEPDKAMLIRKMTEHFLNKR